MVIVRGTRRFLDRTGGPTTKNLTRATTQSNAEGEVSTTTLGDWYATVLPWRPQVALLVNETTLLPVLTPLAPAHGLLTRLPTVVAEVLTAHGIDPAFIHAETAQMTDAVLAPTRNRSVVGIMNEVSHLADHHRRHHPHNQHPHSQELHAQDLLTWSIQLAATPCSPLYRRHISPDRELRATVTAHRPPPA